MSQTPLTASNSYEETLQFLNSLDVSAMKLGLDRVRKILATLDNPQDSLPMVHIAGTNGKGSVTAMLASILKASGLKVGSFTSPHLIQVRERIGINGNPILPDDFQHEVESLKHHLETLNWPRADWPTYFEFLNIVAYRFFKQKGVDITVFETGLGGRLDSTNVVSNPNLTAITTIGMDHTQHLGKTLRSIAEEKAGIIKKGVPVVLGAHLPAEAHTAIVNKAQAQEAPVFYAQPEQLSILPASNPTEGLLIHDSQNQQDYRLSLLGPYQKENLAIVLACVRQLRLQGFPITEESIQEGLRRTYWPVRFQYFRDQHLILDGSHNPDGFATLADSLQLYFPHEPKLWLISLRNNREPEALIDLIGRYGPPLAVFITKASPAHLYHSPEQLAQTLHQQLGPSCLIFTAETPMEAYRKLQHMRENLPKPSPLSLVTGSLYTAGEILGKLETV